MQVTINEKNKHVNEIVTKSKQIREITMFAVASPNLIEYVNLCYKKKTICRTHIKIRIEELNIIIIIIIIITSLLKFQYMAS